MLKTLGSFVRSFKKQEPLDELTSPEQLSKGDMLRFSDGYGIPEELRGETFQVQKVATYFYNDTGSSQFIIKSGDSKNLYLSIENVDGEELIVISKQLKSKEVDSLFGWDQLRAAMKNEDAREITTIDADSADNWLANRYSRRVFGASGHYFEKDIRDNNGLPSGGETFTYFEYYTSEENKSLEIEVWEADEIEVSVGLIRPMTDIVELWRNS
jgi:hypothetical protein